MLYETDDEDYTTRLYCYYTISPYLTLLSYLLNQIKKNPLHS